MRISRKTHFQCDVCRQWAHKSNGRGIRKVYTSLDKPVKTLKSRTIGRQCLKCLELEEDYNRDPYIGNRSPGDLEIEL